MLLENALTSNQRSHYYLAIHKLVMDALQQGTIQTVEYAYNDVYYRLSALFIARKEGRAMILMCLNTFDAEQEVKTAREIRHRQEGCARMSGFTTVQSEFLTCGKRTIKSFIRFAKLL